MSVKRSALAGLLVSFVCAGCVVVPGPRGGASVVPVLPPVVVLGPEPYYVHEGYYYHYRDDGWYYSRSRQGPWADLPRDHYPREVRHGDGGPQRDKGGNQGRHGR